MPFMGLQEITKMSEIRIAESNLGKLAEDVKVDKPEEYYDESIEKYCEEPEKSVSDEPNEKRINNEDVSENLNNDETLIGDKKIKEWNDERIKLGVLSEASLSGLSKDVGIYILKENGKVMYIGRATEYSNGGFRKRLSDYTRDSDSARKHKSGQLINKNASKLEVEIIKTGNDAKAAKVAEQLEKKYIQAYKPDWNVQNK